MSSLKKKLNDRSNVNRLSTVEDAYSGLPASQTNFKGKWKGYDASGNGIVRINGKDYSGQVTASFSVPSNYNTVFRVGKDVKNIVW